MIIKLQGVISHRGKDYVIFDVGAVGYRLVIPEFAMLQLHGTMSLFCHEVHRDDAHEIFGFLSLDALELFWKLISVSGVGPRSAQKIVFAGEGAEVRGKIMEGDLVFLQSVPGIGRKTAQKIVLELKGVLTEDENTRTGGDEDALQALVGLGYKRKEALEILKGLEGSTEEKIKSALKSLAR